MGACRFRALTAYTYSDAPGSFSIEHDRAYIHLPHVEGCPRFELKDLLVMGYTVERAGVDENFGHAQWWLFTPGRLRCFSKLLREFPAGVRPGGAS